MKVLRLGLLSAGLICTACAAGGTQVKESQLSAFQKGKTTDQEVVATLGQPNVNSLLPDGARMMCYSYSQMAVRPQTFIPLVGGFIGGADMKSTSTCFQFAANGILKEYTTTASQIGSGSGLASGIQDSRVPNEPRAAKIE